MLHTDPGAPLTIGKGVTIGHQVMLHGCTIGDGSLIGIGAVVLNHSVIGKECLVGAGAVVTEGKTFPDRAVIFGSPAKAAREVTEDNVAAPAHERRELRRGAAATTRRTSSASADAMIDALDHLDARAARSRVYETLLGRRASDGRLRTGNVGLASAAARAALSSMVFATPDLDKAATPARAARGARATRDGRRSLALEARTAWRSGCCKASERALASRRPTKPRASPPSTMSWCARPIPSAPSPSMPGGWGSTSGSTAAIPQWGARLLFFRCGDLVVEIAHDLKKGVSDAPDELWGLSLARARHRQGARRA